MKRTVAYGRGVGAGERPARLGVFQVGGLAVAVVHRPAAPFTRTSLQLSPRQLVDGARRPHSRGDVTKEPVHNGSDAALDVFPGEVRGHEADPAVDVIAHSSRGYHAVLHGESRHSADGEAVAEMDVRHGQRIAQDARQAGHVADLLQALVLPQGVHEL